MKANKNDLHESGRPLTKEEFIDKIKTDNEFANRWGDLGPIYGKQWRHWEYGDDKTFKNGKTYPNGEFIYDIRKQHVDQISNLINDLKNNPDSRRIMVNAWNVGEIDKAVLPPCHYGFQVWTRELTLYERVNLYKSDKDRLTYRDEDLGTGLLDTYGIPRRTISLMWNQRSVDTFLGLPFNIASYGLLLEIIAKEVNMVPDELIGILGDTHVYLNHIEQVKEQIGKIPWEERKEQLTDPIDIREFGNISPFTEPMIHYWLNLKKIPYSRRMPFPLPKLVFEKNILTNIFAQETVGRNNYNVVVPNDFILENYQSHPSIKAPLSN